MLVRIQPRWIDDAGGNGQQFGTEVGPFDILAVSATSANGNIAIQLGAVQSGTDRTAAELAVARLTKEIAEAEASRKVNVDLAQQRVTGARKGRLILSVIVFVATYVAVTVLMAQLPAKTVAGWVGEAMSILTLVISALVAAFVFKKTKLPLNEVKKTTDSWDLHITRLKEQLAANRAVTDDLPRVA